MWQVQRWHGLRPEKAGLFAQILRPDNIQIPAIGSRRHGMGDMGGMMLSMFRSYSVKNYEDEIKMLKQWLSERLKVLDEKLDYHS